MFWNDLNGAVAIVGLVFLLASAADSKPRKTHHLATGIWGGQHIRIAVRSGSAAIEYDCAKGTIAGPLSFDSKGKFSWKGTHSRDRGGPTRIEEPGSEPAIFSGSVQGATMTLTVTLAGTNESAGTFKLVRGNPGKIFKCK
jgi:hypothetical protein